MSINAVPSSRILSRLVAPPPQCFYFMCPSTSAHLRWQHIARFTRLAREQTQICVASRGRMEIHRVLLAVRRISNHCKLEVRWCYSWHRMRTFKEVRSIKWYFLLFSAFLQSKRIKSRAALSLSLLSWFYSWPRQTTLCSAEADSALGLLPYQRAAENRAVRRTALHCIITTRCTPSFVILC